MSEHTAIPESFEGAALVDRLTRDVKEGVHGMSRRDARFLVYSYYAFQRTRIRLDNQVRAATADCDGKPHDTLVFLLAQSKKLERQIALALDHWTRDETDALSVWTRSISGIGPVLCAGFKASLDITSRDKLGRLPGSPAAWYSLAGLVPVPEGEKHNSYSRQLKTLCWKTGESFVKRGKFYRAIFEKRRAYEEAKNEAGDYVDQARAALTHRNWVHDNPTRHAYEAGRLPQARIHERCKRYAVKLFVSHYWSQAYLFHYGEPSKRLPYAIEFLPGHSRVIPAPLDDNVPAEDIAEALGS